MSAGAFPIARKPSREEGVARCAACRNAQSAPDEALYCRVFGMVREITYTCRCTAFRLVAQTAVEA